MWSSGTGSEVMKRIAAPMLGGMLSATVLTLVVVPAIYGLWKGIGLSDRPPENVKNNKNGFAQLEEADSRRG
jgi:Cu(I)/Ag(I) efflux system membrane protein CusA/SilA